MTTTTTSAASARRVFLVLSAALLVYGNGVAYADRILFPRAGEFAAVLGLVVGLALLAWAVWGAGLSWRELGFNGAWASLRGGILGAVLGFVLAGAALVAIWALSAPFGGVAYPAVAGRPAGDIAYRLLVTMPLDTTVLEEVAFRGALLAVALRAMAVWPAVVWSSVVFTLWHLVVNYHTLAHTTLAESLPLMWLGVVLAHLGVFIGGVLFCVVRLRMGLVAAVMAHWTINVGLMLGFWLR